ncbi:MAG: hypothetical protein ACR2J8_04850, partial [Thermomicrobiales bacterium]
TSPVIQRIVATGEPADFSWIERLPPNLPDGAYSLTLWFHRRGGSGWEHELGGGFGIGPLVVESGRPRWAGPIRLGPLPHLVAPAGQHREIGLQVSGQSDPGSCIARWSITASDGGIVAGGAARDCGVLSVGVPLDTPEGSYRLTVNIFGLDDGAERREDGQNAAFTVLAHDGRAGPR